MQRQPYLVDGEQRPRYRGVFHLYLIYVWPVVTLAYILPGIISVDYSKACMSTVLALGIHWNMYLSNLLHNLDRLHNTYLSDELLIYKLDISSIAIVIYNWVIALYYTSGLHIINIVIGALILSLMLVCYRDASVIFKLMVLMMINCTIVIFYSGYLFWITMVSLNLLGMMFKQLKFPLSNTFGHHEVFHVFVIIGYLYGIAFNYNKLVYIKLY
jgi:hypothetical protein